MAISNKPQLLSFLTCDNVHVDPGTRKHTLLGLFSGLQAMQFPMKHPNMFVFISLTELGEGEHKQRLSLALPGQEPLVEREQAFKVNSPLQRVQLINQLQNVEFPHSGDYDFMLEIDDEPVLVLTFPVREVQLPPGMKTPQKG
ncbi:MAG: hypothetical protein ACFB21_07595 [Opitutales bacterium]